MTASFRSRALRRFWEKGDCRGLNRSHLNKIGLVLDLINAAASPEDMNIRKLDFHKLTGFYPPRWSVPVNGNWCITFGFEDGDAAAIDYEDCH